jgi:hypothetical protein
MMMERTLLNRFEGDQTVQWVVCRRQSQTKTIFNLHGVLRQAITLIKLQQQGLLRDASGQSVPLLNASATLASQTERRAKASQLQQPGS